jgi:hypothetical protein
MSAGRHRRGHLPAGPGAFGQAGGSRTDGIPTVKQLEHLGGSGYRSASIWQEAASIAAPVNRAAAGPAG